MTPLPALLLMLGNTNPCRDLVSVCLKSMWTEGRGALCSPNPLFCCIYMFFFVESDLCLLSAERRTQGVHP